MVLIARHVAASLREWSVFEVSLVRRVYEMECIPRADRGEFNLGLTVDSRGAFGKKTNPEAKSASNLRRNSGNIYSNGPCNLFRSFRSSSACFLTAGATTRVAHGG